MMPARLPRPEGEVLTGGKGLRPRASAGRTHAPTQSRQGPQTSGRCCLPCRQTRMPPQILLCFFKSSMTPHRVLYT